MEEELFSYLRRFDSIGEAEDFLRNRCVIPYYFKLTDETFPKFVRINVGWVTGHYFKGYIDEDEWKLNLMCDIDSGVSETLIQSAFVLWSDKLDACYAHIEGCSEKGDEKEFEECYIGLIRAYNMPELVGETVKSMIEQRDVITANIRAFWSKLADSEFEDLERIKVEIPRIKKKNSK